MRPLAFLMRHATPDWSRTDIPYDVPPGPPLTPAGEAEAHAAAQFLLDQGITRILVSPLARTHRTGEIIAAHLNLPYTIAPEIAEWRGDENEDAVAVRSRTFWDTLWTSATSDTAHAHDCPLLVTHGGPSRLLLHSLGLPVAELEHFRAQFDHNNPMPPAGIWRIEQNADTANASLAETSPPWTMKLVFAPVAFTPYPNAVG
ncbi:MAG: histidine phosphatase family protein [Litorilinea sp.]